jgi:hypothetical protein
MWPIDSDSTLPRKSVVDLKSADKLIADAIEELHLTAEIKGEIARDVYDAQNEATRTAIDSIVATLRKYATGYVSVQLSPPNGALVPVKIENEYLAFNLLYLAIEIAKDLSFLGIRLSEFKFPPSLCMQCGAELGIPEVRKRSRG